MTGIVRGKRHRGIGSHERLHHVVARELGIAIVSGRYAAGEILPGEMAASEQLRISRPAYREAIRTLAAKGLVESRPKAGTRVCERSRWNLLDPDVLEWLLENAPGERFVRELFDLRMIIEPAAAGIAAEMREERHLEAMAAALKGMAENEPDGPAGQAADQHFHEALFAATGNEILIRLTSIVAASVHFIAEYKRARDVHRDPAPDHVALYEAIAARAPQDASAIMRRLLLHARQDMLGADDATVGATKGGPA